MKYIIIAILLTFITPNLFAQFQICNSSTNNDLYDVWFIDQNTGIAVGDSGTIVRSSDGGLNWSLVMSDDTVKFKKVKFFDALNGIAIGSDMYRTSDAGQSWSWIPHANSYFYDIEILNQTTCLISGYPAALIRSADKGASFSDLIAEPDENMGLLSFVDENIGYACGQGRGGYSPTLKTINGGVHWDTLAEGTNYTVMEAMSFVSESTGFKGGWYNPHLQKTTDGANEWNFVTYDDVQAPGQLLDFHIEDNAPNAYYACGWYGEIYKSTDEGNNWISLNSGLSGTPSLYGIYFISDSVGWVVGHKGTIIKTTNGGITVGLTDAEENPGLTLFPNPTKGWTYLDNPNHYEIILIELYDIYGHKLTPEIDQHKINMASLPDGAYFLKIKTNKGDHIERVIKK